IWFAYADVLHDELCKPNGTLHKKVILEPHSTGTSIVLLIMNQLMLPPSSAMIVAPIAASILGLGVKAFCRHGGEDVGGGGGGDYGECK
ncbi:MAG TPA: hypothetical protein VGC75_00840, partial [Candidatus Nitrosocosmicus sp.]